MLRGHDQDPGSGLLTSSRCLIVNFETWSYSQFYQRETLPLACLSALTTRLGSALDRKGKLKADEGKAVFEKASNRLMNVIKNVNITVPGISIPVGKVLEGEEAAPPDTDLSQEMIKFKNNFQELVEIWQFDEEKNKIDKRKRVVICVDDLDRVKPVIALEMLEAIKNFLDVDGCVFILAVDFEVVQAGMKEKLGIDVQKSSGKSFFDKIIQLPFNMPKDSYDLEKYLGKLIKETELPYADGMDPVYLREITSSSVGSNPRSIKRVMNYARLIELILKENSNKSFSTLDSEILYALICLQIAWPELFAHFLSEPTSDMMLNLENWEYLDRTPQLKPLFERVPDEERLKNNISTFFDTLFGKLDDDKDGQISDKEFGPVMKVMKMAQFTSVDIKPRPRDQLVQRIKENADNKQDDIVKLIEDVYQHASIYLNAEVVYRPSGTRYMTLVYKRKQLGSIVTLKTNPLVIRLNANPETLKFHVRKTSNVDSGELNDLIVSLDAVVRNVGEREASLTGFGDTIVNNNFLMEKMKKEPSEAIKLLNLVTDATSAILTENE